MLNEEASIGRLLDALLTVRRANIEIIIVDGGSTDRSLEIAHSYDIKILKCKPSRACQLNLGVKYANHEVLYFVHADTLPPSSYFYDIENAINEGFEAGCYRSKFDSKLFLLKLNEMFTRLKWLISKGGDQSLFISKELFNELDGYKEEDVIMEEYPLIEKLLKRKKFKIFNKTILISTRKYNNRSWLRVSKANTVAFRMYKQGESKKKIQERYNQILG